MKKNIKFKNIKFKNIKLNNIISQNLIYLLLLPFFALLACQTSLKNTKSVNDPEKIFDTIKMLYFS